LINVYTPNQNILKKRIKEKTRGIRSKETNPSPGGIDRRDKAPYPITKKIG